MDESGGWCTIESDPGVFTELVEQLGVRGIEFQEVFALDDESLSSFGSVYGLIFLFKYRGNFSERPVVSPLPEGLFFAKQVVQNACATQAILSVLLNTSPDQVHIGKDLSEFKEFAEGLDEESRGFAIGNSEIIKSVHNSFRPHVSLEIGHEDDPKGEAFHFVSYVWFNGKVYELDGLQSGPIEVGVCEARDSWLSIATPSIQSRIAEYTSSGQPEEIRFNLMALVEEPKDAGQAHEEKRARWKKENARRRHDFIPLGLACLQTLAGKGKLVELFHQVAKIE